MSVKTVTSSDRFRFRDLLIILIFLLIAFYSLYLFWTDLMSTFSLQNETPVGTVIIRKNTVQRRLSDRVLWDRLAHESPVYIGDLIRVAQTSAASLIIGDNEIFLEENTLIRILLSPDGEGLMIEVSGGSVSVAASEEGRKIFVQVDGRQEQAQPGVVLTAAVEESGSSVKTSEYDEWLEDTGRLAAVNDAVPQLVTPAINSHFRYQSEYPVINFQWEEIEDAASYIVEASNLSNFSFIKLRVQINTPFYSCSGLDAGVWYWRVTPVYPAVFKNDGVYSSVWFFRIELNMEQDSNAEEDLSQWLAMEDPNIQPLPEGVPQELIPVRFIAASPEPVVEPEPAPVRAAPSPPALLASPQILQPARNSNIGHEQLSAGRTIVFRWQGVQGANAYVFALYQQTESGRRQIVRTSPINRTNYTMDNLSLLDRGNFVWQVEAISVDRVNAIQRRGTISEGNFTIDFPSPRPVIIESVGTLYGN